MKRFQILLTTTIILMTIYTIIVVNHHGINVLSPFFGDILKFSWSGQFNLDFFSFLLFASLWIQWRHNFTTKGYLLTILVFFGGTIFFSSYLLYLSYQSKNAHELFIGPNKKSL